MKKTAIIVLAVFLLMVSQTVLVVAQSQNDGRQGFRYECADYFEDSRYYTVAKWEWEDNEYVLSEEEYMYRFFETNVEGTDTNANWTSKSNVEAVIVKGALERDDFPGGRSGSVDNSGVYTPDGNNNAAISHITFCGFVGNGGNNGGGDNGNEVPEFGTFALIAAILGATAGMVMLRKN